jgi:hypothetical protein
MSSCINTFKLDPGEGTREVRIDTACRLLGGVDRSTVHRLLGSGVLRGRIDRNGWRWVTMPSIKRYQDHQRVRGPTGRPRKSTPQTPLQLVEG